MKKFFSTVVIGLCIIFTTAQETKKVFGTVSENKVPLKNAQIKIMGTEILTLTDAEGNYEIDAAEGQVLEFSYNGMKTLKIKVEDVTRILNISMVPEFTQLDEVVVRDKDPRTQESLRENYESDKNIIKTAYGYINTYSSASSILSFDNSNGNLNYSCIIPLLRARFPVLTIFGNCSSDEGQVFLRGINSISNPRPMLFDVEGQLFTSIPLEIQVPDIKRIAILRDAASRGRYGTLGFGGVIVINMKKAIYNSVEKNQVESIISNDKVFSLDEMKENRPTYLKELYASSSIEEAKTIYEAHAKKYSASPYFYMDAYQYFYQEHDEVEYADDIISNNFEVFGNNAVLLKALGYIYESQKRFDKANVIAEKVFILRPNYVQSYRDLAYSYRNTGDAKQAAVVYSRYYHLVDIGFIQNDTVNFGPIMKDEFDNLVALEKGISPELKRNNKIKAMLSDKGDIRLVFEWNDSEAEFDLEFIKPNEEYYTWKHTLEESEESITSEKKYGYNMVDYHIDGRNPGIWMVNFKYLGNKSLTPTYLKVSIYQNYGSKNQTKNTMVHKLRVTGAKQQLLKFVSGGGLAQTE